MTCTCLHLHLRALTHTKKGACTLWCNASLTQAPIALLLPFVRAVESHYHQICAKRGQNAAGDASTLRRNPFLLQTHAILSCTTNLTSNTMVTCVMLSPIVVMLAADHFGLRIDEIVLLT